MTDLLQPGQIFAGRYRIERFLAQGGMGAVFVAEQLATERRVALKVLWPQILSSAKAVEQFQLEARVAARVQSEHIVQILDAGRDDETGKLFLVMELLQGQPLQGFVEAQGALAWPLAITLLRQVALGLDKAHGYVTAGGAVTPIVHRDLKPENLFLIRRDSGEPHIKILDFGLAKVLSETASVSTETKGTPLYMAIEQVTGDNITPQTDIWALGLIAFFLLTGRLYWASAHKQGAGIHALFAEILSMPMPPASLRLLELGAPSHLPAGFDGWLARCIDRDPIARFASAGQAIAALEALASAPVATQVAFAGIGQTTPLVVTAKPPTDVGTSNAAVAKTFAPSLPLARRGSAVLLVGGAVALAAVGGAYAFSRNSGAVVDLSSGLASATPSVSARVEQTSPPPSASPNPDPTASVSASTSASATPLSSSTRLNPRPTTSRQRPEPQPPRSSTTQSDAAPKDPYFDR